MPELPEYYLAARGLLEKPLPALLKGPHGIETVANAPSIRYRYAGKLAKWRDFNPDALRFLKDLELDLERCAFVPIYMDPNIQERNSSAMTFELIKAGAEITLSGRFFWNALAVTSHIVATLSNPQHGQKMTNLLPKELTFGDSWTIPRPFRVPGKEPDIVLFTDGSLRAVGELKFCNVVDFEMMIKAAITDSGEKFRAILGQVVDYMIGHRLKYAFISNYDQTIFFKVQHDLDNKPCVYFSDVIKFNDVIDERASSISVRLALLYFTRLTCAPTGADWKLDNSLAAEMGPQITKEKTDGLHLSTPIGDPKVSSLASSMSNLGIAPQQGRPARHADTEESPLAYRQGSSAMTNLAKSRGYGRQFNH